MTNDFKFEVRGSNRVANKLRRLAAANSEIIEPVMWEWGQDTRKKLKSTPYPPKPSTSKYVRTGQLANRWAVQKTGSGKITFSNEAQRRGRFYTKFVVGDGAGKGQAWMHKKNKWWIARNVINDHTPDLVKRLTRKIRQIWDSG